LRILAALVNFLTDTKAVNMGVKRPHEGKAKSKGYTHKPGFKIGPANLPDGTHRRASRCSRLFLDRRGDFGRGKAEPMYGSHGLARM
jgi:hypothetical protein